MAGRAPVGERRKRGEEFRFGWVRSKKLDGCENYLACELSTSNPSADSNSPPLGCQIRQRFRTGRSDARGGAVAWAGARAGAARSQAARARSPVPASHMCCRACSARRPPVTEREKQSLLTQLPEERSPALGPGPLILAAQRTRVLDRPQAKELGACATLRSASRASRACSRITRTRGAPRRTHGGPDGGRARLAVGRHVAGDAAVSGRPGS